MTPLLKTTLDRAWALKQKLWKQREHRGALDFHFPESKIVINKQGKVVAIKPYPIHESNALIESFMVLANASMGRKYRDIPFLYRVHEAPTKEDIEKLQEILRIFHIPFTIETGTSKEFASLLLFLQKHHPQHLAFLQKMILRTLSKAIYTPVNKGHF